MKIRSGFVSNSSSSSFTCDICGENFSGYDMCLSDCEMVESQYGMYCESHLLKSLDKIITEISESDDDKVEEWEIRSEIPDQYCPLYNLKHITNDVLLQYLLKRNGLTKDALIKDIQDNYSNLEEVLSYYNS